MTISHEISVTKFQISSMKIFSEIFDLVYKIILHFILLLIKQHELLIFSMKLNIIYKTNSNYIFMKHYFSMLNDKKMKKSEFKVNEFYITAQSVRQISCDSRSVKKTI